MGDVAFLQRQATDHGAAIGRLAQALREGPLPWTRMRQVSALLGLVRRFGAARVDAVCADALAVERFDVHRLKRMLEHATPGLPPHPAPAEVPPARFLRPPAEYALGPHGLAPAGGDA